MAGLGTRDSQNPKYTFSDIFSQFCNGLMQSLPIIMRERERGGEREAGECECVCVCVCVCGAGGGGKRGGCQHDTARLIEFKGLADEKLRLSV